MKLYIDSNLNLNVLKIISTSQFCSQNIILQCEDFSGFTRLPLFETSDGTTLFSSNAICRYLFEKSGNVVDPCTDAWLEWETLILQPSIWALLNKQKEDKVPSNFLTSLHYLETILTKQDYLSSKSSLGLADIIIWSNLYPVLDAFSIFKATNFPNIKKWLGILKMQSFLTKAFSLFNTSDKVADSKKRFTCTNPFSGCINPSFFTPISVPEFSLENFSEMHIASKSNEKNVSEVQTAPKIEQEEITETSVNDEQIEAAYISWLKGLDAIPKVELPEKPILPKEGEKNVLITSALPYVNNVPHLGNIIGAVLSADVFARYCRLRGYNTLFICGTDEYGTATETKAIELGVTPKEICDKYNKLHTDIYNWFNISFDYFGRTTTELQTKIAQDIFKKLYDQNLLLVETVEQLFCETCSRFLADRFVEGICPFCLYEDARGDQCDKCGKLINAPELKNPQCKVCRSTPHMRSSKHLFLDLPKLEPALKEYLDKATANGYWSNTAKVITYSWIKDGLKPRCITRDLKWGTPVPLEGFTDKVFYVWFDAPIGYLSITANYTSEWEKWWKQPDIVQLYQFMAKDNVPFHSIIFPACEIGTKDNYTMVNHLVATEYLNYEEAKFSKSRGVGVFGDDAKETAIPSDIWRFYLLYLRPESQDTYFSWSDLMLKNNSELLNNLGNFINRSLSFISNNFSGIIPEMQLGKGEKLVLAQITCELQNYISCMDKTRLRDAIRPMLNISRIGNQYIQSRKPWEMVKSSPDEKAIAGTVLGLSSNICCLLCTLMEPYMPDTCKILKDQMNTQPQHHVLINEFVCLLPPGHKIGKPAPLFKKIDQEIIIKLKEKYAGRQSPQDNRASKKSPTKDKLQTNENLLVNGVDLVEVENLSAQVTEQGNKVRQLKTDKADKADIDKEVAILLDLKKKLAIAKGENPEESLGKSKSKKKR